MEPSRSFDDLPPLPDYTLQPQPSLIPPVSDKVLNVVVPIVAYWILSLFFHWIDLNDYFSKYRLHTPAELLKRNHVTKWEVVRDVVIQQLIQIAMGLLLTMTEPDDMCGKENYDITVWARRIRIAERAVPGLLALLSVDAQGLAGKIGYSHPMLAGLLAGGAYPSLAKETLTSTGTMAIASAFAPWEMLLAKVMYWMVVPLLQYAVAIFVLDTWQYFWHRAMHENRWLYTTFHYRHHRLYVPYAFGALYNHPVEGFLLDTLGASVAYKLAGLNIRQGMWFFTGSSFKTVDDHCGYKLPWDPLQFLTSNNAGYHDIHHQSWGIKSNFSQPFFTFWDHIMGTVWTGGDVSARYERSQTFAQKMVDNEQENAPSQEPLTHEQSVETRSPDTKENRSTARKGNRRRTASSLTQSDSLRGLRERVSIHGRTGGILGMDHSH